jgi:predicted Zn-dependent protease
MCLLCTPFPTARATRRALLAAAAVAPLAACDEGLPVTLVSDETVEKLGLKTWSRMRADMPPSRNAERQQVVRDTSDRLLAGAGENPADWEVVLFARPDINAFALPGGRIGVFEGMFRVAANQAQLAAVIGHV